MANVYIVVVVLVIVGWVATFICSRLAQKRAYARMSAEFRVEFRDQIDALAASVRELELARDAASSAAYVSAMGSSAKMPEAARAHGTGPVTAEEITPEILHTITETITALLGRRVRIRSVKILQTPNPTTSSWAQQGRVVVQASHNFSQRGRE